MIVNYPTCSVSTLVPLWEGLWKDADNVYMKSGFNPKYKPGVLSCMVKGFGFCYFVSGIWQFGYIMLQFASPQLLNALIAFVEDPSQPSWKGYLFAALLAVVALVSAICDSQYWLGVERVGLRLRSAISGAVYRKTLRLSNSSRKTQTGKMNGAMILVLHVCLINVYCRHVLIYIIHLLYIKYFIGMISAGEVVNLLSVDCQKLQDAALFINFMWASPLQVGLAIFFLYQTIGWSVFVGKF